MAFVVSPLEKIILRFLTSQDQILENPGQDINTDGVPGQTILLVSGYTRSLDQIDVPVIDSLQPETFPLRESTETIISHIFDYIG